MTIHTTTMYRASGKGGRATRSTPRQAALAYFEMAPRSTKCDVQEGTSDAPGVFTVTFSLTDKSTWPAHWPNVTKKAAQALPDAPAQAKVAA